jgi:hypothetical protein
MVSLTLGLVAVAAAAMGDAIQKWQTPDGSLYFGDRPPKGSTLVETYADTPALPTTVGTGGLALSQAAADGRDIIRRREAERNAERQADTARELGLAEIEASQIGGYYSVPFWFTGGIAPCRFGEPCGRDSRFVGRHVPRDANNHFFFKNSFISDTRFLSGPHVFGSHPFFPKASSQLRLAPALPHARQTSSGFGGRH